MTLLSSWPASEDNALSALSVYRLKWRWGSFKKRRLRFLLLRYPGGKMYFRSASKFPIKHCDIDHKYILICNHHDYSHRHFTTEARTKESTFFWRWSCESNRHQWHPPGQFCDINLLPAPLSQSRSPPATKLRSNKQRKREKNLSEQYNTETLKKKQENEATNI